MRQYTRLVLCLLVCFCLFSGCAAFRALMPGGVTPADSEWSGIKSGQPVSIAASLDPGASQITSLLSLLSANGDDPLAALGLGVLLPVTLVGETQPRWIICDSKLAAKCNAIPIHAEVHFAGEAVGPGILWKPKRLRAANFDD